MFLGKKEPFCIRSEKHKFEIKVIKLIGAIEGVLLSWKISRNYRERCPKRWEGNTEVGDKSRSGRVRSRVAWSSRRRGSQGGHRWYVSGLMKSAEPQFYESQPIPSKIKSNSYLETEVKFSLEQLEVKCRHQKPAQPGDLLTVKARKHWHFLTLHPINKRMVLMEADTY